MNNQNLEDKIKKLEYIINQYQRLIVFIIGELKDSDGTTINFIKDQIKKTLEIIIISACENSKLTMDEVNEKMEKTIKELSLLVNRSLN